MKIVFACGGTGGHINPAIAIADTLKDNVTGCEILFVGATGGMEESLVKAAGYPIVTLDVQGVRRGELLSLPTTLKKAHKATKEATVILERFAPDIVIGTGGYACYPALKAAIARGIPTAVHESNALPGLAVRLLAQRVSRVWLGLDAARAQLPRRAAALTVGNPLPRGFERAPKEGDRANAPKVVLSFGGSLGATVLNDAVLDLMELTRARSDVRHVHATGKREWERFMHALSARGLDRDPHLEILPYISDMPRRLRDATVVVCRAGAMSIGEIAMAGRAAVLVPSPNVTGNHQFKNAKALADGGAALLVEEREIGVKLAPAVLSLLDDAPRRARLEASVLGFAHPNANKEIYLDILRLIAQK